MKRILAPLLLLLISTSAPAKPVEFAFRPTAKSPVENPFARELWAEVRLPDNRTVVLPAYFAGHGIYAVRARPEKTGVYRLGSVLETGAGGRARTAAEPVTSPEVTVATGTVLPAIGLDPEHRGRFRSSEGRSFTPVGTNLAWSRGEPVPYYRSAIERYAEADLNWMRIWMAHWGRLNLDWLPERDGRSPPPGLLDPTIASNWDQVLAAAERHGVYVQLVLQHHGQYSTRVNPNWHDNPWNVANGGFLPTASDFFTSERARALTRQKYRYIVARWGWSPAIFAWELFNEVHWVDAWNQDRNEAAVAAWHSEMAEWIRSIDAYDHLVTTSTEKLQSPIYDRMDFFQPHLYAADLLVAARRVPMAQPGRERPVFYGEVGDDHLDVSADVKAAGVAIVPPAWAGLFGQSQLPAQPWLGWDLLEQNRLQELGAVHRFIVGSGLDQQPDLQVFSPPVESDHRMPLHMRASQVWQRRPSPEVAVPLDGRIPLEYADIPRVFVGSERSVKDGFPSKATYRLDLPKEIEAIARVTGTGNGPTALRIAVDGQTVAEKAWEPEGANRPTKERPAELSFSIPAGRHTLVVENSGGVEWVEVASVGLAFDVPAIAGAGLRNERFMAVWVWDRVGVYSIGRPAPADASLHLEDVPAGDWHVTWWDTFKGAPAEAAATITHAGGVLRLPARRIVRHAAVVLTRGQPDSQPHAAD